MAKYETFNTFIRHVNCRHLRTNFPFKFFVNIFRVYKINNNMS